MKESNKLFNIENKFFRIFILMMTAILGIILWWLFYCTVRYFFGAYAHVTGWVEIFILSFLVLLSLWVFRTYDTRQQIEKTEEQNDQNKFLNGLENLTSENALKIDVGVKQLIDLSKSNDKYDSTIRLAFIRRLKTSPLSPESKNDGAKKKYNRLEYAQYILIWFMSKGHSGGDRQPDDKRYCDFENQMFVTRKAFRAFAAFCKLRCGNGNCPEKRPCHDCDYAKEHEVTLSTWNIHNVLLDGELPGRCPGDENMKTYPKEWGFEDRDLENYKYYYRLYDTSKETSNQPK